MVKVLTVWKCSSAAVEGAVMSFTGFNLTWKLFLIPSRFIKIRIHNVLVLLKMSILIINCQSTQIRLSINPLPLMKPDNSLSTAIITFHSAVYNFGQLTPEHPLDGVDMKICLVSSLSEFMSRNFNSKAIECLWQNYYRKNTWLILVGF